MMESPEQMAKASRAITEQKTKLLRGAVERRLAEKIKPISRRLHPDNPFGQGEYE